MKLTKQNQSEEEKMSDELIPKNEKNEIVNINIPDETIDDVIAIGDDVTMWAKLVDGGFSANDRTIPELVGIICNIHHYCVKWEGKTPHKIPNVVRDEDIPEGYERRIDIKIYIDGHIIGISISKATIKYYLSKYLRYLKENGFRPEGVITKLQVKQASNSYGVFNVVTFEMVDTTKATPVEMTATVKPETVEPAVETAQPQLSSNPWA